MGGGGKHGEFQRMFVGRLSGLKNKLVCHLKLAADMVGDGIREFACDADGSAFLKMCRRDTCGFVLVDQNSDHTHGPMPIHEF